MQIINRIGNLSTQAEEIEFHHLGHIYRVELQKCFHPNLYGKVDTNFLLTPEMICVREDCPECKRAAEERGILGYRTPAQTCFPLTGDSEAMEMHLRYRIQSGKSLSAQAGKKNLSARQAEALAEIKAKLSGDKWAEERLATCLRHLPMGRQRQGVEV